MPAIPAAPANEPTATRLLTRSDALATLRIGETTLFWLQRTGKLNPIRIGSRVLFNASEIKHIATHGASLSKAEKEAAAKGEREAIAATAQVGQSHRRGRSRKLPANEATQ
jgi:hypothetical protein